MLRYNNNTYRSRAEIRYAVCVPIRSALMGKDPVSNAPGIAKAVISCATDKDNTSYYWIQDRILQVISV